MDNYLIDRETLSQFVDELIKKQPLAVNSAEELNSVREAAIKSLNDKITAAVFGQFTPEQTAALRQLLARPDATEQDYENFFEQNNLDVEQTIADAMQQFAQEFTGGQNA